MSSKSNDFQLEPREVRGNIANIKPNATNTKHSTFKGVILVIIAAFFMSTNGVLVKSLHDLSAINLTFYRFSTFLIFILPIHTMKYSKASYQVALVNKKKIFLRSFFGFTSLFCLYFSTKLMPVGDAALIFSTSPVFVSLLGIFLFKEKLDRWHLMSLGLLLIGISLVARLPLRFTGEQQIENADYWWGFLLSFVGAMLASGVFTLLQMLRSVEVTITLICYSLLSVVISVPLCFATTGVQIAKCGLDSRLVLSLGLTTLAGQYLITLATHFERASTISLVRACSEMIILFGFQSFWFKDRTDVYSLLAVLAVVGSLVIQTVRVKKNHEPKLEDAKGEESSKNCNSGCSCLHLKKY